MATSGNPKRAVFEQFARVAKALAHEYRLELIEMLGQGERSVDTLARLVGLSLGNASQHLQLMRRAGLLIARKSGKQVLYRLADRDVVDLVAALRRSAERGVAEIASVVDGYFRARDDMEAVGKKELLRRLRDGVVTVIDVRPPDEFAAGHIRGAINIPLSELKARLRDLPPKRPIVAYCRGPYCVLAFEAVAAIRAKGLEVRRLDEGYPEWQAAGLPVSRAAR
jgi:rhodanese-related sulfurtransferase/DNA-binding transcriptional ArsR family regulator